MIERRMNDGLGILGSFRQACGIVQCSAMSGCAGTRQFFRAGVGTGEADHLMASGQQAPK